MGKSFTHPDEPSGFRSDSEGPNGAAAVDCGRLAPVQLMGQSSVSLGLLGETTNATCSGLMCQACAPEGRQQRRLVVPSGLQGCDAITSTVEPCFGRLTWIALDKSAEPVCSPRLVPSSPSVTS